MPQYHRSYGLRMENAFASLKTNKSSGYDDISADVVKKVSDEIFVILKYILNLSLAKGVFPDKIKIARVTPIFKKQNNTLETNYRPISVLPYFSKLLEGIIYTRLYKFLVEKQQSLSKPIWVSKCTLNTTCYSPISESNHRSF